MEDIICGTFLIVGLSEDNFASQSQELLEKYKEKFRCPEFFARTDEGIIVLRMEEEGEEI